MASYRCPMEAAMRLPSAAQGWRIATAVRQSLISAAGNGRFVSEAVRAGTVISVKPVVPMAQLSSLRTLSADQAVSFSTVPELEHYITLRAQEDGGGVPREQVLDLFEHFVWSLDGSDSGRCCLNLSTWSINHAHDSTGGLNVEFYKDRTVSSDGKEHEVVVGEAMVDLEVDTELFMDYRTFDMPHYYLAYCDTHGFKDVRTSVLEAAP